MAKVLMGAVVEKGKVEATFRTVVLGSEVVGRKETAWPAAVTDAAKALIDACDALTPEEGDVVRVQVYTEISDPAGTPNTAPGELVDITFAPGSVLAHARAGQDAAVPADIAAKRDALKSAISAALNA